MRFGLAIEYGLASQIGLAGATSREQSRESPCRQGSCPERPHESTVATLRESFTGMFTGVPWCRVHASSDGGSFVLAPCVLLAQPDRPCRGPRLDAVDLLWFEPSPRSTCRHGSRRYGGRWARWPSRLERSSSPLPVRNVIPSSHNQRNGAVAVRTGTWLEVRRLCAPPSPGHTV